MGRTEQAIELMDRFTGRTGVIGDRPPRRYLWTDAHAVCNLLALAAATGNGPHTEIALRLVDQVHHVLGRHRADDRRTGWISGLDEREGEAHPTRGGLRIGKPLPERGPRDPVDERLEWDRDGQYFHYLTRWMHALDQLACATGQGLFNLWARELAEAGHRGFCRRSGPDRAVRMIWKASIDLSRPLIDSMGQHDPVDGFITCVQLEATAIPWRARTGGPDLTGAASDFEAMIQPEALATADPLGLGGLLTDAWRVDQLVRRGALDGGERLRDLLLSAAGAGLRHLAAGGELGAPVDRRLAFRELGLAIGLAALERLLGAAGAAPSAAGLERHLPMREAIESFWLRPEHRAARTWLEHEDINDVMLATCLAPEGVLVLWPHRGGTP